MRRFNSNEIYTLSEYLKYLETLQTGDLVRDSLHQIFMASNSLRRLLEGEPVPIKVTRQTAEVLRAGLESWLTSESIAQEGLKFESFKISILKSSLSTFNTVLNAELANLDTFWVEPKGIYSTSDLIENADNIFGKDTQSKQARESAVDINEAGKALTYDLPTAVGFRVWRAAERELRGYYQRWTGQQAGNKAWGALHNELAKTNAGPESLAVLVHLRNLHRNPTMHPEEYLTLEEAISLFGIAHSAITEMINDQSPP